MSSNINELRRNNTSGVPGLRLNKRKGHQVVDVAWYSDRRYSTSFLLGTKPTEAVEQAMFRRTIEVGAEYDITPRQAWERLKRSHKEQTCDN